jgi:hypothetical protein
MVIVAARTLICLALGGGFFWLVVATTPTKKTMATAITPVLETESTACSISSVVANAMAAVTDGGDLGFTHPSASAFLLIAVWLVPTFAARALTHIPPAS